MQLVVRNALKLVVVFSLCSILLSLLFYSEDAKSTSYARLKLGRVFGSHMVFQREREFKVWGTGHPTSMVALQLSSIVRGSDHFQSTVGSDGRWEITLPAYPTSTDVTMQFSSLGASITLYDVAFGEVWLCSGQSNMRMPLSQTLGYVATDDDGSTGPLPRIFDVPLATSLNPLEELSTDGQNNGATDMKWQVATLSVAAQFSSICYQFGRNLSMILDVPVGLVQAASGGTYLEAWANTDIYVCTQNILLPYMNRATELDSTRAIWRQKNERSVLYNGMLYPLRRVVFAGVLWYQGENNLAHPTRYSCMFPIFLSSLRTLFDNPSLPLLFVEIAPWVVGKLKGHLPYLRYAQQFALSLPDPVAMASALDIYDPLSPSGDIHQRQKQPLANRLLLLALSLVYKRSISLPTGPRFRAVAAFVGHMDIYMTYATGLRIQCTSPTANLSIELGVLDARSLSSISWQPFDVVIVPANDTDLVTQEAVLRLQHGLPAGSIAGLRYAWQDVPSCILMNAASIPAHTFVDLFPVGLIEGEEQRLTGTPQMRLLKAPDLVTTS
eukprot:GILJ01011295.1.p1 GENE.GILJ01011295.1~~GILJ01011295.1.p1  ORF type:complete len:554 (-),score=27.24 GILJ01011295.1:137-1798(-)